MKNSKEDKFKDLEADNEIEKELEELKKRLEK